MSRRNMIPIDDVDVINSVWAYNRTKKRFQFDCKTYEKDGIWYWIHSNEYARDVDKYEQEFMQSYLSNI
jgi:hypothetical protein